MASGMTRPSIGKTGVHLQYQTNSEYHELTMDQKKELGEWHSNNPDQENKKAKNGKDKCPMKKQLSSVVAQEVKKTMTAHNQMCCPPQQDEEIAPEKLYCQYCPSSHCKDANGAER